jgi:hypothetical protein
VTYPGTIIIQPSGVKLIMSEPHTDYQSMSDPPTDVATSDSELDPDYPTPEENAANIDAFAPTPEQVELIGRKVDDLHAQSNPGTPPIALDQQRANRLAAGRVAGRAINPNYAFSSDERAAAALDDARVKSRQAPPETALERTGPMPIATGGPVSSGAMHVVGEPTADGNGITIGYGPVPDGIADAIHQAHVMTRNLVTGLRESGYPASIGFTPTPVADALAADPVNHPDHYTSHPSGIECIEVTEHAGFNIGNAIKYLWRTEWGEKGDPVENLRKAAWYIQREIDKLESTDS